MFTVNENWLLFFGSSKRSFLLSTNAKQIELQEFHMMTILTSAKGTTYTGYIGKNAKDAGEII